MSSSPTKEEGKESPLGLTTTASNEYGHHNLDGGMHIAPPSKITTKCLLLMFTICTGGFLFGYDIGVISGCLIMKDFVLRFGGGLNPETGAWELPTQTQSLITSLLGAGTFFGALLQAPISDWLGRQKAMVTWAVVFTVGAVIQTATETSLAQMIVGRFIAGLSVGALSGLCPLYLGETAPKAIRGMMVSGYQLLIITGIAVSYGISWGSSNAVNSSASWRIPVGLQMLWGVALIGLMVFLPESPRWELQRGNHDRARVTMASMRGISLRDTPQGRRGDDAMEEELEEMEFFIGKEREVFKDTNYLTSYVRCFSLDRQLWRRTLTGCLVQVFQQLNGQNFYYYYGPTFFSAANVSLNSYEIQFILGIVSWVCTFPALYLIDKAGRRRSLIWGNFVCFVCAFIVAFVGKYSLAPKTLPPDQVSSGQHAAGNAFIAFAVFHLASFSVAVGPTPWVLLSELYPQELRAKCVSLGSASNWFWNFMLGYFSPPLSAKYESFIMLIFGSLCLTAAIFVFLVLPETRGLSLEQVDLLFQSGVKPWKSRDWVPPVGDANRNTLGTAKKVAAETHA